MEKRVLTLELVVEQNTKMVEQLDRSMVQLTQAVADLWVQMGQRFADMRQEMIAGFAEERKSGDKRFFWLLSAHLSTFIAIVMPPRRINEIVKGLRGITVDTALRLATFFGTGVQSWINLQTHCDLELVRQTMTEKQSRF